MAIDKKIDYVAQDGVKNYVKDSKSVTVPEKFKARKNAPTVKLAYITDAEAKMLKKNKPGTPHKGPQGVPSYDSFDAEGSFTSGAAMSAAETGSQSAADRREVRASNIGAPRGAGPGVISNQERDLRSSIIAAGGGQRVNPGFFDSRNVVSPAELARARAFNPAAFQATRGGGIMNFFTGGGLLGNIVRGLGQRFGLGKTYDQPTYDMSGLNTRVYEAIPGASTNPNNLDIYNEFVDEEEDSTKRFTDTERLTDPNAQYLYDRDRILSGINTFVAPPGQMDNRGINSLSTPEQTLEEYLLDIQGS